MNENGQKVEHVAAQMFLDGQMSKEDYEAHVERMERIYHWEAIGLLIAKVFAWLYSNINFIFQLVQTIAIMATILIMIFQLRSTTKSNRALASLQFTTSHREIWSHLFTDPTLERIQSNKVDLKRKPIRLTEEFFVIMILNHMSAVYYAYKQGLGRMHVNDFVAFFRLPIPKEVWAENKQYQNPEFVKFVDEIIMDQEDEIIPRAPVEQPPETQSVETSS